MFLSANSEAADIDKKPTMMQAFKGRSAVITGGASGIGRATALLLKRCFERSGGAVFSFESLLLKRACLLVCVCKDTRCCIASVCSSFWCFDL